MSTKRLGRRGRLPGTTLNAIEATEAVARPRLRGKKHGIDLACLVEYWGQGKWLSLGLQVVPAFRYSPFWFSFWVGLPVRRNLFTACGDTTVNGRKGEGKMGRSTPCA